MNASLAVVRHILNYCARKWRDDKGRTLLETAPLISMLPLDDARKPRPISWTEQRKLLPLLPAHLQRMALCDLNTGARDDVVCNLRWEWEVYLKELECSAFIAPPRYVKGRKDWPNGVPYGSPAVTGSTTGTLFRLNFRAGWIPPFRRRHAVHDGPFTKNHASPLTILVQAYQHIWLVNNYDV